MKARSIVMLILGILLSMAGAGLLFCGIGASWLNLVQNDDGYLTSPQERFAVDTHAIVSASTEGMRDDVGPAPLPFDVGSLRISGESANPAKEVFIGIAARADVERYLGGSNYSELREVDFRPFRAEYREVAGTEPLSPPAEQEFWVASAAGPGQQEVNWNIESGNWSVVIMNTDASPGLAVDLQAGFRSELFGPIAAGLLAAGVILLVIGVPLLVFGARGLGRRTGPPTGSGTPALASAAYPGQRSGSAPVVVQGQAQGSVTGRDSTPGSLEAVEAAPYPARLSGEIDPLLSRWMWLVKWFLAIPHLIVLFFLWFAFAVVTIVAGFAILFTGRYPHSLFVFNVGVLRWNWRVAFYAYAAVGTDRYPPFTLSRTDYPADFEVDYPERLSRGLVLVKWWLLSIPHLLVVAAFTSASAIRWSNPETPAVRYETGSGISLLGLLVLIAAVILLFSGRYQRPLFGLILGINRWIYRVITYVALLRDEYPPFRLDQGSSDNHRQQISVDDGPGRPPAPPRPTAGLG
ncbi:uncharacterized protein DUF4389 [Arthrobacter sp. SLBN-100]|uniref:DUF4389 domain-containing protein n=1 Tax=Arthrobacter sp. SLBN-100 TaxID=2768450 RepID=UPI0011756E11|nr:DUF4389 domain-containing protein [Arthrobacter sp. SLBN-100]TQJ66389.1 uncharacterized protein DUF4389 [Arthrobacter sp. SLBN-100]